MFLLHEISGYIDLGTSDRVENVVWPSRESIGHDIGGARAVNNVHIKVSESIQITDLALVEILCALGEDILGGRIICDESETSTSEVVTPLLEGMDDGKEFLVMNWIVALSIDQLP